ncbi:MAG: hypothetical protein FVQ82_08365 [Planctomycetes bacterium]|nr:hypothetical protein [Planctomycetota bacterium]
MAKRANAMFNSNEGEGGKRIKRLTAFAFKRNEEGVDIKIIGCFDIKSAPSLPFYSKGIIIVGGRPFSVFDLQVLAGSRPKTLTDESCIVLLDFDDEYSCFSRAIVVDDVSEMLSIADQNMAGVGVENLFGCQPGRMAKGPYSDFPEIEPKNDKYDLDPASRINENIQHLLGNLIGAK